MKVGSQEFGETEKGVPEIIRYTPIKASSLFSPHSRILSKALVILSKALVILSEALVILSEALVILSEAKDLPWVRFFAAFRMTASLHSE